MRSLWPNAHPYPTRASQPKGFFLPSLSAAGCVRPGVGNGEAIGLESLYRPGDIITIECNAVNVPRGPHKSQCQPGGMWDPPLPACSRGKRLRSDASPC